MANCARTCPEAESNLNASEPIDSLNLDESLPNEAEDSADGHQFPPDYHSPCQPSEYEDGDNEEAGNLIAEDRHPAAGTEGFWARDEDRPPMCIISGPSSKKWSAVFRGNSATLI